jgi:hypothetical protein
MLFDETVRQNMAPAAYSEGEFTYLDQSGRPEGAVVRHVLEDWFSHYPEEHKEEFRKRFRSGSDENFHACVFELYVYELLRACRYSVEVHPEVQNGGNKRPDFLAHQNGDDVLYVECTIASDGSDEERAAETRKRVVYDTLDRMESPDFFLDLQLRGAPTSPPPGAKLRRRLSSWLTSLSFDEVMQLYQRGGLARLPTYVFEHNGWRIIVRPIPKSGALRGQPGVRPIGTKTTASSSASRRDAVQSSVIEKASRYGRLNAPYIIAVNCKGMFARERDYLEALYGDERDHYNGVWLTTRGRRYARVSGVLGTLKLDSWQLARRDICLYHNPHAELQYVGALIRLRQCNIRSGHLEFTDGVLPRDLLHLPEQWPECSIPG